MQYLLLFTAKIVARMSLNVVLYLHENFCEEIRKVPLNVNNPIQKLDGLVTNGELCTTGWSCDVSSVTTDAKNTTNREFLMGHYVMNQDDVCGKSIKMINASELLVLHKNCLLILSFYHPQIQSQAIKKYKSVFHFVRTNNSYQAKLETIRGTHEDSSYFSYCALC
jgi:hypothetical protein